MARLDSSSELPGIQSGAPLWVPSTWLAGLIQFIREDNFNAVLKYITWIIVEPENRTDAITRFVFHLPFRFRLAWFRSDLIGSVPFRSDRFHPIELRGSVKLKLGLMFHSPYLGSINGGHKLCFIYSIYTTHTHIL